MKEVIFYFDVVCPYAYLASSQVHELNDIPGVRVLWQPVVLGFYLIFAAFKS